MSPAWAKSRNGRMLAAAAALAVAGAAGWGLLLRGSIKERSMTSRHSVAVAAAISTGDLARVSGTRVFFGHQSVGANVLDALAGLYAAHGAALPPIEQGGIRPGPHGGFIDHAFIGENGNPFSKIEDFAAQLRSGLGGQVDVAMMKFCYVDVNRGTDVGAVFDRYRQTMAALAREFPNVAFIYVTVPLTTEQGLLSKVKSRLSGGSGSAAADNAARERLNALIRHEYAGRHLFDLAAIESTAPDGSRVGGRYEGQRYYALYRGYASDSGHLNPEGARIAATAWLRAVARAGQR